MLKSSQKGLLKNTINVLGEYKKIFILSSLILIVVYTFLYGLWKIPLIDFGINRSSEVNFLDYLFILLITILSSLFIALLKYEKKNSFSSNSASGVSGIGFAGIISTACPACQSIGILGLGSTLLNIPTEFLTPFLGVIKISTISLLGLAVFLKADSIYTKECKVCNIKDKFTKK